MSVIEFSAPIRIESEMNRRDHWSVRRKRFQEHKAAIWGVFPRRLRNTYDGRPLTITLIRIGPRTLDSDNLAGGCKGARDQIAQMLSVDDGDPKITWIYKQERGGPKEYALRVRIEGT